MRCSLLRRDYDRLFSCGKRVVSGPFRLIFLPASQTAPRIGFVLPKRFLRRAVDRNRVRRVVREYWRLHVRSMSSYDIVIQLCKPLQDVFLSGFVAHIEHLFRDFL